MIITRHSRICTALSNKWDLRGAAAKTSPLDFHGDDDQQKR